MPRHPHRSSRNRGRSLLAATVPAAAVALLLSASGSSAQVLTGSLTLSDGGGPVDGAMVSLVDSAGRTRLQTLTDGGGRFRLMDVDPGRYEIVAERIGHRTVRSESVELTPADTVHLRLETSVLAVSLEGLTVEGEGRCTVRPGEGEAAARLWDEARKALAAASWTQERAVYRFEMTRHVRELDRSTRRVESEQRRRTGGYLRAPFESHPAEKLVNDGFVEPDGEGGHYYYAPGAAVLLSDLFLDTHCMRARSGEEGEETEGLVGLGFEPVDGRRVPDIRGTLWLDPATFELQWLEYGYDNLDLEISTEGLGGRVVFEGLPDGTWIIRDWWIRTPRVGLQRQAFGGGERRRFLMGYLQEGGTVLRVRDSGGDVVMSTRTGTVAGVVLDSTGTAPLPGARVRLAGTDRSEVTDDEGRFGLTDLDDGLYELTWRHPALDSAGVVPEPVEVGVERGEITEIRLRAPARSTYLARRCLEEEADRPADAGVLSGTVVDRGSGEPVPGARVAVEWSDWTFRARLRGADEPVRSGGGGQPSDYRVGEDRWRATAVADEDGEFLTCTVPADHPLTLRASVGPVTGPPVEVRIPEGTKTLRTDVPVTASAGVAAAGEDERSRAGDDFQPGDTVEIEGVTVEARRSQDQARRADGFAPGELTPEEMDDARERVHDVVDVLRSMGSPRIRIAEQSSQGLPTGFCVEWTRGSTSVQDALEATGGCRALLVVVDGRIIEDFGRGPSGDPISASSLLLTLHPEEIRRVEVLSPTQARFQFGVRGEQGALVIETRRGGPG